MSVIIENSGLLTTIQSLHTEIEQHTHEYTGAIDKLAFKLANELVGNLHDSHVLEMTARPATLNFTEPTLVAFTGAEFNATCNGKKVLNNRVHMFDRGDRIEFKDAKYGTRVYMGVAGGIKPEGSNILKSGDEVVMLRNYSEKHDELFSLMRKKKNLNWGVDSYALLEVYISDLFHIVKRPGVDNKVYEALESGNYTVQKEKHRFATFIEGKAIDIEPKGIELSGVNGGVFIKDNQPIIALNDFNDTTTLPHVGTIPSYHMHKLAQKRAGSEIQFKCIEPEDVHANLYTFHLWVKSLFKAIDYKLSKEFVKEKM